ncbi:MAG TPA: hypothetical protein VMH85_18185 [Terriglobales bacterium]|nr:hypothetical protein [Terriglobales bacterium]
MLASYAFLGVAAAAIAFLLWFLTGLVRDETAWSQRLAREKLLHSGLETGGAIHPPVQRIPAPGESRMRLVWAISTIPGVNRLHIEEKDSCEILPSYW